MTGISQSEFLQALGWAVLNSLWQMALLWVVYQSVTAIFSIKQSSQRSALATSLLMAGFAWFIFTFVIILSGNEQGSGYTAFIDLEINASLNILLQTILPVASIIYLLLLTLPVINFIRNYRYVQVIRQYGLTKADVEWRMFVKKLSARMGINKPVQVWMSELVSSPVTIGYLKPVILLPVAAVSHLSSQQVEAVLLHELSHIRRFDYLINLISRAIQSILYFNPFVKAFSRIIESEREKSCDEMVMQFEYEPHGYASALLTLEKAAGVPVQTLAVAAAGVKRNELLGRIETILGIRKKQNFSFLKLAGVMAALLCFIGLNAIMMMSKPENSNQVASGFMAQFSTPFLDFTGGTPATDIIPHENHGPQLATNAVHDSDSPELAGSTILEQKEEEVSLAEHADENATDNYSYVNLTQPVVPELNQQQEENVKEALNNSKKVIETIQWKEMEKSMADALNQSEKEQVKKAYEKVMDAADWDKMAEKMRIAYDQIDWNTVKNELNTAVAEIKLDSLQQAYNGAMLSLTDLKKELNIQGLKGIPDSDITLKAVEVKLKEVQVANEKLKAVKSKRIIKL